MVDKKKLVLGKIGRQIKIYHRGLDKALNYRTMTELYLVSEKELIDYKEKLLIQEARNQEHDRRLQELIEEYKKLQII